MILKMVNAICFVHIFLSIIPDLGLSGVARVIKLATRALGRTFLALAAQYAVNFEANRDCSSAQLLATYRSPCEDPFHTPGPHKANFHFHPRVTAQS